MTNRALNIELGEKVHVFHRSDKEILFSDHKISRIESAGKNPREDYVVQRYPDNWIKVSSGDVWRVMRGKDNVLRTMDSRYR